MSASRVGVVVVNHDGGPYLARALDALGAQERAADRVIVIDNASRDGSADAARRPGVELLERDFNVGFAAANNLAIDRLVDCDLVALLNPDAFPEPGWLAALLSAADAYPAAASFASRIMQASRADAIDAVGIEWHVGGLTMLGRHGRPQSSGGPAREVFAASAAGALYRREAFLATGGFDPRYFCYAEDTDLGFRLRLAGHGCRYVPDAVVHHVGLATSGGVESEFAVYQSQRNLVWTWAKDMPGRMVWTCMPQLMLANAVSMAWFTLRGRGRSVWRAKRDALRGLPAALRARRAVQRGRVVGPHELRPLMRRGITFYIAPLRRKRDTDALV